MTQKIEQALGLAVLTLMVIGALTLAAMDIYPAISRFWKSPQGNTGVYVDIHDKLHIVCDGEDRGEVSTATINKRCQHKRGEAFEECLKK